MEGIDRGGEEGIEGGGEARGGEDGGKGCRMRKEELMKSPYTHSPDVDTSLDLAPTPTLAPTAVPISSA